MSIKAGWGFGRTSPGVTQILQLLTLLAAPACSSHVSHPNTNGGGGGGSNVTSGAANAGAPDVPMDEPMDMQEPPPPMPVSFGWCDAQPIIVAKCGRCHADPAQNGAPFSLTEYADTQVVDSHERLRYERMRTAIETDSMPALFVKLEPPVEPLTDTERQQLLDWLDAGAPLGDAEACSPSP